MGRRNLLLLAAAAVIAVVPLFLSFEGVELFAGADGVAQAHIQRIAPDYRPWAAPVWEPPSSEVASLLFALQAAMGAGLLGYYLGLRRAQAQQAAQQAAQQVAQQVAKKPGSASAAGDAHR